MKALIMVVLALFMFSCGEETINTSSGTADETVVNNMVCAGAQFSPDSRYIAWGGEKYKGLFVKELSSGSVTEISNMDSSGWKFSWAPDSSGIAFRESVNDRDRHVFRISKRIINKDVNEIIGEFEHSVWPPLWRDSIYSVDTVRISGISLATRPAMSFKTSISPLIYNAFTASNRVSLIGVKDGKVRNFSEGTHSPAISPNGRLLLYIELNTIKVYDTVSGSTQTVGDGSSASWVGNSKIVYTQTADNGSDITYSEVRLFDLKSLKSKLIPVENGRIPLFPSISSDGGKLIYTDSVSGHLFIRNLPAKI